MENNELLIKEIYYSLMENQTIKTTKERFNNEIDFFQKIEELYNNKLISKKDYDIIFNKCCDTITASEINGLINGINIIIKIIKEIEIEI